MSGMRLSWPQHLETARTLGHVGNEGRGVSLALMGMALLMLAQDLLDLEPSDHPDQVGAEG